jgi:hypothetical protein
VIWLLGVMGTVALPVSKFHLLWIYVLGAITPYAIMNWRIRRQMDIGTSPVALAVRRHLEEESGGEVWSWPEMLRSYKVSQSTSPQEYANVLQSPELSGWWVAREPGVGRVTVIRRADKAKGSLLFKETPRFYFCWTPD